MFEQNEIVSAIQHYLLDFDLMTVSHIFWQRPSPLGLMSVIRYRHRPSLEERLPIQVETGCDERRVHCDEGALLTVDLVIPIEPPETYRINSRIARNMSEVWRPKTVYMAYALSSTSTGPPRP